MEEFLKLIEGNKIFEENRNIGKRPIIFSVVALILIFVTLMLGEIISAFGLLIFLPETDLGAAYYTLFLGFGIATGILFLYIRFFEKVSLETIGFGKKNRLKKLFIGFFIGAASMIAIAIILLLTGSAEIVGYSLNMETLIPVLIILPAWFVQSSTEEIFFRGFYLNRLGAKKPILAITLSSLAFAAVHMLNPNMSILSVIALIMYGLFAALYMIFTEDLFGVCGFHTAWNYFQGSILGFEVSGNNFGPTPLLKIKGIEPYWFSGGNFGVEGGILTILVLLFGIICLIIWKKRRVNSEIKEY